MDKGLHADGHELRCVIVVVDVHMGVGLNIEVGIGLTE